MSTKPRSERPVHAAAKPRRAAAAVAAAAALLPGGEALRAAPYRESDVANPPPVAMRVAEAATPYRLAPQPERGVFGRMSDVLHQPLESESDVVRAVTAGLPASTFRHLTEVLDVGYALVGSESTIRRRLQDDAPFSTDESERMVRIARLFAQAVELFGDEAQAKAWLAAPGPYLSGSPPLSPLELAVTDAGARMVEGMLLRTAHGIF
jgi:putative toxin-antitoxin system antitoxin component (TIGR02293 family)